MSFSDDLALEKQPRDVPCATCNWYKAQTTNIREAFDKHVAEGGAYSQLHRVCQKYGLASSRTAFVKHVQEHCDVR